MSKASAPAPLIMDVAVYRLRFAERCGVAHAWSHETRADRWFRPIRFVINCPLVAFMTSLARLSQKIGLILSHLPQRFEYWLYRLILFLTTPVGTALTPCNGVFKMCERGQWVCGTDSPSFRPPVGSKGKAPVGGLGSKDPQKLKLIC